VLNGRSDAGVSKYNEIAKIKCDYSKHRLKKHGSYRRSHKINETDRNSIMKIRE
jgi:hypothetical protein